MGKKSQLEKLKIRIPYNELDFENVTIYDGILEQLLEDSKNIALSNLYPFKDWSNEELPKRFYNWQLRACKEIYNFYGKEGIKSYSENGLSYSRISDNLSQELQEEIIPNAGYITRKQRDTTNDYR